MSKNTDTSKKHFSFFPWKRKKVHPIEVYFLYPLEDPQPYPLYCTTSLEDMKLAASRIVFENHLIHYNLWCSLHDLAPAGANSSSWKQYFSSVVVSPSKEDPSEFSFNSPLDRFSVTVSEYDSSEIASVLRMFLGVKPLFISCESQKELEAYIRLNGENPDGSFSIPSSLQSLYNNDTHAREIIDAIIAKLSLA